MPICPAGLFESAPCGYVVTDEKAGRAERNHRQERPVIDRQNGNRALVALVAELAGQRDEQRTVGVGHGGTRLTAELEIGN